MTDQEKIGMMIWSIVCALAGAAVGVASTYQEWQKTCVRHGVAEYNQTTAQWQWKVPLVKEPERTETE